MDADLIIIIISVIALLVNAVLKGTKKKRGDTENEDNSEFFSSVFETEDEDNIGLNFKEQAEVNSQEDTKLGVEYLDDDPHIQEELELVKNDAEQQETMENNVENIKKNGIFAEEPKTINEFEENEQEIEEILESFDLKSAVIYSEIINRKSY